LAGNKHTQAVAEKLFNRFNYFDGLQKTAHSLANVKTKDSVRLLDATKKLIKDLQPSLTTMDEKFPAAELEEFWDVKAVTDMAHKYSALLKSIEKECDTIRKDSMTRKHALTNALTAPAEDEIEFYDF